jgi:hypothetical protein
MSNPDFSAQTAEPMTPDERRRWFNSVAAEFREKGATHAQASCNPDHDPPIYLVEGWKVRPEVQPAPQFHMKGQPDENA